MINTWRVNDVEYCSHRIAWAEMPQLIINEGLRDEWNLAGTFPSETIGYGVVVLWRHVTPLHQVVEQALADAYLSDSVESVVTARSGGDALDASVQISEDVTGEWSVPIDYVPDTQSGMTWMILYNSSLADVRQRLRSLPLVDAVALGILSQEGKSNQVGVTVIGRFHTISPDH